MDKYVALEHLGPFAIKLRSQYEPKERLVLRPLHYLSQMLNLVFGIHTHASNTAPCKLKFFKLFQEFLIRHHELDGLPTLREGLACFLIHKNTLSSRGELSAAARMDRVPNIDFIIPYIRIN